MRRHQEVFWGGQKESTFCCIFVANNKSESELERDAAFSGWLALWALQTLRSRGSREFLMREG